MGEGERVVKVGEGVFDRAIPVGPSSVIQGIGSGLRVLRRASGSWTSGNRRGKGFGFRMEGYRYRSRSRRRGWGGQF